MELWTLPLIHLGLCKSTQILKAQAAKSLIILKSYS